MREGLDNFILKAEDNEPFGICFGCDFTAEHEWGIDGLRCTFGVNTKRAAGITRRTITRLPALEDLHSDDDSLVYFSCMKFLKDPSKPCPELRNQRQDQPLRTAWDESSFGAVAFTQESKAFLKELHEAILNLDVAMWVGSAPTPNLKTAGLVLAIVSLVPENFKTEMRADDLDREDLQKAAEETGIRDKLSDANLEYFALSPRWAKDVRGADDTSHPVVFWLNPCEQDKNNFGYFTVEDLTQWVHGEGPIPKNKETT